jgi:uncharacterized protein with PIN domain
MKTGQTHENEATAQPLRSGAMVRTTNPRCPKCEAETNAVAHNAGNIPGLGYHEETQFRCKGCGHEWWS